MTIPEEDLQKIFAPLKSLEVQVDEPTKDKILQQIHARAQGVSWFERMRDDLSWLFHPVPAMAAMVLVLAGGITWYQFQNDSSSVVGKDAPVVAKRTLYLTDAAGDVSQSSAMSLVTEATKQAQDGVGTLDMRILPIEERDSSIDNRYIYQFQGNDADLSMLADSMIYKVTFRQIHEEEKNSIAQKMGFSSADRQDTCSQMTMYSEGEMPDCTPEQVFKNSNGYLGFAGDKATYFTYTTVDWESGIDPWQEAATQYDQLPEQLSLLDTPKKLMQYLIDMELVSTEIASELSVIPTSYIEYACPEGLYAQTRTASMVRTLEKGSVEEFGCYQHVSYDDEAWQDENFEPQLPKKTPYIPKPYRRSFVVVLSELGGQAEFAPLLYANVDHQGELIDISGRLVDTIEFLPTQSASVAAIIDALNARTIEPNMPNFAVYSSDFDAGKEQDAPKTILTHSVFVERVAEVLSTYQGADGSEYYVPSYNLIGMISQDEVPENRAARQDRLAKERCQVIQEELNALFEAQINSVDVDALLQKEVIETTLPQIDIGEIPEADPKITKLYDELETLRCFVFDYDPSERQSFETQVSAFLGLSLITGGSK